jgi:hypothetical protein
MAESGGPSDAIFRRINFAGAETPERGLSTMREQPCESSMPQLSSDHGVCLYERSTRRARSLRWIIVRIRGGAASLMGSWGMFVRAFDSR